MIILVYMKNAKNLTRRLTIQRLILGVLIVVVASQIAIFAMFFRLASLHDSLFVYAHDSAGNVNTLSDCVDRGVRPCELPNRL